VSNNTIFYSIIFINRIIIITELELWIEKSRTENLTFLDKEEKFWLQGISNEKQINYP